MSPPESPSSRIIQAKGLAEWLVVSRKLSVQMTSKGLDVARVIDAEEGLLSDEKEFLATAGRRVTEQVVQSIVSAGRGRLV